MGTEFTPLNDKIEKTLKPSEKKQTFKDIQQPIGKDGYENPKFTEIYGYNPFKGTDRDRSLRKKYY